MLRLSNLDSYTMGDDQRDTFIDMAEISGSTRAKLRIWSISI